RVLPALLIPATAVAVASVGPAGLPGRRVEEQSIALALALPTEAEEVPQRTGLSVEREVADPARAPVVLDEPQDRALIGGRVVHEIVLRERGDHQQRLARPIPAPVLVCA